VACASVDHLGFAPIVSCAISSRVARKFIADKDLLLSSRVDSVVLLAVLSVMECVRRFIVSRSFLYVIAEVLCWRFLAKLGRQIDPAAVIVTRSRHLLKKEAASRAAS